MIDFGWILLSIGLAILTYEVSDTNFPLANIEYGREISLVSIVRTFDKIQLLK